MTRSVRVANVVAEIEKLVSIAHPPVKLVEVAAQAVGRLSNRVSREQSFEYAERHKKTIRRELEKRINSEFNVEFGYFSNIAISDISDEYIHGSCYILANDSDSIRIAKENRSHISHIEDNINSLDQREFEFFCGKILYVLGVENPVVTRSSNDQGIDFFGLWPHQSYLVNSVMPPGMERQLRTWIFGQAKRYRKSVVSTSEIRELVGAVELARSKSFSKYIAEFSDVTIRPCDPIFQFFITTGRATTGVMELMAHSGMIYMDSHLSAVFLADRAGSLGVDFRNRDSFKDWISKGWG